MQLLTTENYKNGFLVDDEVIAGVTEMNAGTDATAPVFSVYVSHYLTGETYAYQEFDALEPALFFLAAIKRPWAYEAVGCSKKTKAPELPESASGGCGSSGCSACACK